MTIPRIIHFVWIGDAPLPAYGHANIEAFAELNPTYQIMIHGEEILDSRYAGRYAEAEHLSTRADLIRYSALRRYGGWYFDVDFIPFRPLDDAVRAWDLDGRTMFLSTQRGNKNDALRQANAPLAARTDWPGWALVDEWIDAEAPVERVRYGPRMITHLVERHARLFTVADWPWFFPAGIGRAGWLAQCPHLAPRFCAETGGQKPFAMHLWAHGVEDVEAYPVRGTALKTYGDGARRATMTASVRMVEEQSERPFAGLIQGLNALGYGVDLRTHDDPDLCTLADLVCVWNGYKTTSLHARTRAEAVGCRVLYLEHGFFDRRRYTQVDHEGILHWSSWRRRLKHPAPPEGAERLARFYPDGVVPVGRRDGYGLVLGQLAGDTQMLDSEIQGPAPLERLVKRSLPPGAEVYFRPHPLGAVRPRADRPTLPRLPDEVDERVLYRRTQHGAGLQAALAGARFMVCINSNSINEALALGVPCLAFGPHLGIEAGVVRHTTAATLTEDLRAMARGWHPDPKAAENYLRWLACRQWTGEELADPATMRGILAQAGVEVPDG